MEYKELKRLIELVEKANISHLSIDEDGTKVEIKKELTAGQTSVVIPQAPIAQAAPVAAAAPAPAEPAAEPKKASNLTDINAEMVGTFYESSSPDSAPFVKVGDTVKKGQVICIIEAMKLFNEIESDADGIVEEICVSNEDPIEFGQTLFRLKKA